MAVARKHEYTSEEYFALEESSEERHAFVNGEIYAMAGGTADHNLIALNIVESLRVQLRNKPCRVQAADLLLQIKKLNMYTYPDVMLICGKLDFQPGRKDVVTNPVVIFEVLSESTSDYDHTRKFAAYRQLASLQEYVMVQQNHAYVECFRRLESGLWVLHAYEDLADKLELESVGVEIPLKAIYEQVELEE